MNIFKKSRKSKEEEDTSNGSSTQDINGFAKASRSLGRKKRKEEVQDKPVFDLASALPDRDEFRTSLLMPNLSARFSMLREQDDPTTKIGKASDDSVLFPKQSSRHHLLNGNFLSDIAEVESIYSTFRPPMGDDDHKGSMDGNSMDDGSIMNRSRPVETNNLFGGRQKLYKVNASSSSGLAASRYVYDSDVSLSSFQQSRRGKEQFDFGDNTDRSSVPISDPGETDSVRSPLTGFSRNRETHSSTNSAPSHRPASTAATSVMSESPVPQSQSHPVAAKAREYDASPTTDTAGLAVSLQSSKSDASDGRRTEALPPRNVTSSRENIARQMQGEIPLSERDIQTLPTETSKPIEDLRRDIWKPLASPARFQTSSPTAQTHLIQDDPLANNVRPNDRGKATAMGLFNKPARHYDEFQFTQRQMQLHQGRVSPPSARSRSESCASPDAPDQHASLPSLKSERQVPSASQTYQILEKSEASVKGEPMPSNSSSQVSSSRPRTKSASSNKEASVKARLESLIRKQNEELMAMEAAHGEQLAPVNTDARPSSSRRNTGKETFLYDDDSDEETRQSQSSGKRSSKPSARSTRIHNPPAPLEIHPAFREDFQGFDFGTTPDTASQIKESDVLTNSKQQPSEYLVQSNHTSSETQGKLDSPTVPTMGLGLSGLIRTHLRQSSNNSSMLTPPSPALLVDEFGFSEASSAKVTAESEKSSPFDLDKNILNVDLSPRLMEAPPTPTTAMSQQAQHVLGIATAIHEANANADKAMRMGQGYGDLQHVYEHEHNQSNHQRNESTETEREQQRFEEELATRRQRIDAKLQNIQERSRSRSPLDDHIGGNITNAFSPSRVPARANTTDHSGGQTENRSMRMLGVPLASRSQTTHATTQLSVQGRQTTRYGVQPTTTREYEAANGRRTPISRTSNRNGHAYDRSVQPRSTTPSSRPGTRNRSASAADRSVSRNEHLPDFDPLTMPGAFPGSPMSRRSPPRDHPYRLASPAHARSYERSTSRNAGPYSSSDNLKGYSPPHVSRGLTPQASPYPSPMPMYENFSQTNGTRPTSPPSSALPSPNPATIGSLNGRVTPTALPGRTTPSGTRKKSVNKGMISDPMFLSSTSSVPLVYLPRDGGPPVEPMLPPPVPVMNPRRRGNMVDDQPSPGFGPHPAVRPSMATTPTISDSVDSSDPYFESSQVPVQQPRQRNRLRKSSSEGGNMAARARQQALVAEMAREKNRSPHVAVFPNRSATSLATPQNANMF